MLGIAAALLEIPLPPELFCRSGADRRGHHPLAMTALGCTLACTDLKSCLGDRYAYITRFMRLTVLPAAVCLILRCFIQDYYLWAVPTVVCAMPCPSTLPILAQRYHSDEEAAGRMIALSTLFAAVSIPLVAIVLLEL